MNLGHMLNSVSIPHFIAEICEVRRNEARFFDEADFCSECGDPIGDDCSMSFAWTLLGVAITISAQAAIHTLGLSI